MSGVRMLLFLKRLMKIHSNPPILTYYGFKGSMTHNLQNIVGVLEKTEGHCSMN